MVASAFQANVGLVAIMEKANAGEWSLYKEAGWILPHSRVFFRNRGPCVNPETPGDNGGAVALVQEVNQYPPTS